MKAASLAIDERTKSVYEAPRSKGREGERKKKRFHARELAERSGQAGYLTVRRGLNLVSESCRDAEKEKQQRRSLERRVSF